MRQLGLREVKQLAQGHTANKRQSSDFSLGFLLQTHQVGGPGAGQKASSLGRGWESPTPITLKEVGGWSFLCNPDYKDYRGRGQWQVLASAPKAAGPLDSGPLALCCVHGT